GRRSCVNDCNGHGRCEEESGRCRCNGNWEGDDCSVRRCPRDCSGHGECINGRCRCDEQWAGKACRVLRCLNGCSSNGKCRNGTCECSQEWTGPDCSAPQCPSGCSGLGQCKNGACECFEGWGGLDCGQPICPDDCSSNGQCVDGRCRCWGGWDGISCSEVVQPSGLQISNIQPTTIDVSWTKASSAVTANQVNCIPMEGTANAVYQTVGPNVTKLTIRDLDSGTQYSVFVYAMIGEALSAPITASVKTGVDTPSQLNYLRIGDTFAEITWTPPQAKVDRYKMVCSCKQGGADFDLPYQVYGGSFDGLFPGSKYVVEVMSVERGVKSGPLVKRVMTGIDKPTHLRVQAVTPTSVIVTWNATQANVEYQDLYHNTRRQSFRIPPNETYVSINGLTDDTSYVINITSLMHGRSSVASTVMFTTEMMKPPEYLHTTEITYNRIALEWMESLSDKIDGYYVTYIPLNVDGAHENVTHVGDTTSTVLEGLEPGTEYLISVFTIYNERGSIPVQLSIKTAIDPPSRLMFVTVSDSAFTIHWQKPVAMVSNYIVTYYRSMGGSTEDEHEVPVKGRKNTSYMLMALRPGILYYVSLATERHERVSFPPVTERFVTSQPLTAPPVVEVSFTGARITWTPNTPDADGHNITLSRVRQSRMQFSIRLSSKSRVVAFNDLLPGTRYRVTIATMRGNTTSKPQVLKFKTDEKLAPPTNISVSLIGETGVNISWIVPSQKFDRIYFSYTSDDETGTVTISSRSTQLPLEHLKAGTTYNISVTALGRSKESFPLVGSVTTLLNPPSNLNVTTKSSKSVELTWKSLLNDVDGYVIKYHELESRSRRPNMIMRRNMKVIHMQSNTTVNVTAKIPGPYITTIFFKFHFFPLHTEIAPPQHVKTSVVSRRSANLTWEFADMTGVTGYLINITAINSTFYREYKVSATKRFVFFQNLFPGHEYDVDVATLRKLQKSSSVQVHFKTAKVPYLQPKDCVQVSLNGEKSDDVYEIFPYNGIKLKVFCDLTTDGGGWIVFQRRRDGSVSFDRSWEDYTTGFGNLTSEFWIGLQTLHELTTAMDAPQSLRIDLHHGDDKSYAAYHNFSISNSDDRFVLSASNYSGTAGDSLSYHYGMKFTTYDSDNDEATRNCAKEYKGAWWFKNCHRSSLNGQLTFILQGVNWYTWGGFTRSIDFVEMKIRPRSFQLPTVRPAIVRRF
uniref:Tenascin-R n=1 Tax=Ciona savignyi TaxID=51511 RepID=H2YMB8_CIOSA